MPEFSDYNKADYNANTDKVDPRLYHTVALPGVPYKYDKKNIFDESWTRNKAVYPVFLINMIRKIFLMNHGLVIKLYTACILL